MITDPMPRAAARRREYERSDALVTMPLPPGDNVPGLARALAAAMAGGDPPAVERAGVALLACLSEFHGIPVPGRCACWACGRTR